MGGRHVFEAKAEAEVKGKARHPRGQTKSNTHSNTINSKCHDNLQRILAEEK